MASYFKQSGAHGARVRVKGHPEVSKSGFRTKADAKEWAEREEGKLRNAGVPQGFGPTKTSLGTGLLSYAHSVTAYQAGCKQALCKINKYLRAAGLTPLQARKVAGGREFGLDENGRPDANKQTVSKALFKLTEVPARPVFTRPQQAAFAERQDRNAKRDALVQPYRAMLATKAVSRFVPADFDGLVAKMREAKFAENTIRQEVAILSGFFTHAMDKWNWALTKNPALAADWPEQVSRERVLGKAETERLVQALSRCTHSNFAVFVLFAVETAMRKGEALWTACWCDVDFERNVLRLPHAKNNRREVPLSPVAVDLLKDLPQGKATERIFGLTDNAAASAWRRLCEDAKIVGLHMHDLKHSSATLWARVFKGDLFTLQKITGNRSLSSLRVYLNGTSEEVAEAMRQLETPTPASAMRDGVKAAKAERHEPSNAPAETTADKSAKEARESSPDRQRAIRPAKPKVARPAPSARAQLRKPFWRRLKAGQPAAAKRRARGGALGAGGQAGGPNLAGSR